MIPRVLQHLDQARQEFTWRELCYGLLPCATVLRWRARAREGEPIVSKTGPSKKQPIDLSTVRARIQQLDHGRRRTAGTTALGAELSGSLSRRRFQELVAEERAHQLEDMKRIAWLVPGTVWSLDTTAYGPQKTKITPVRDLAAKYQLPAPLVADREDGEKIAAYLDLLFRKEGAPMFLKLDLGSPLNCEAVNRVLERHRVLPLNSPARYPQYNGSMERNMRDLHAALDERQTLEVPLPVKTELVTHQLNHRCLRSLHHLTPCQVYHDPARRLRLHGAFRQKVFREVFEQFWYYIATMPNRNHHAINAAWRLIVETWLRRQGWISVTANSKTNVSTDSHDFCSQN
jgi:hypothetical protein